MTVCVTLSLFVHVTFVPTLTVRLFGAKEKFAIETLFPLLVGAVVGVAAGAVVGVAVGAAVGAVVGAAVGALAAGAEPPHAARVSKRPAVNKQSQALVRAVGKYFCILLLLSSSCIMAGTVLIPMEKYAAWLRSSGAYVVCLSKDDLCC